jgi:hypothetical protein
MTEEEDEYVNDDEEDLRCGECVDSSAIAA